MLTAACLSSQETPEMSDMKSVVQLEYGSCLHCPRFVDLMRTETTTPLCLKVAPFGLGHKSRQYLCCRSCGFLVDLESYRQYKSLGPDAVDSSSSSTGCSTQESSSSEYPAVEAKIVCIQETRNSCVNEITPGSTVAHHCGSCETKVAANWRFCPKCGTFLEDTTRKMTTVKPQSDTASFEEPYIDELRTELD